VVHNEMAVVRMSTRDASLRTCIT